MTMHGVVEVLHILACLALILVVLLQADQGEGLSGAFGGGGSYALFGKRGATGAIAQITSAAAVVFMLTSFALTYSLKKQAPTPTDVTGRPVVPLEAPSTGAPLANP